MKQRVFITYKESTNFRNFCYKKKNSHVKKMLKSKARSFTVKKTASQRKKIKKNLS